MAKKRERKSESAAGGAAYRRATGKKGILLQATEDEHSRLRVAAAMANVPMAQFCLSASLAAAETILSRK